MRWFPWSENIKKRSCRYILQRYLGQFLEEKLTLDQLTVDLYNGIGSVSNVTLDVQALNELGEQQNLPIEFIDGFISNISVSIPWSSLLNDSSCVEVSGLYLVIQPKQRADGVSMFESMWSSMTSSIQLAEECLKQTSEQATEQVNPVNGVEEFAKTIDSILTRVKLKFMNAVIRLEHLPKDSSIGGAIEMHIKQFTYYDETSTETTDDSPTKPASAYGIKLFSLEGVEFYTNEFYSYNRTVSRSLLLESTMSLNADTEMNERRKIANEEIILFGKMTGKQEVRLKIKQKENASGPKVDLEMNISTLAALFSPRQLRIVCEIIYGLMSPHLQDTSNVVNRPRYNQKPMTMSDFERVEQELNQQINPSNFNHFVVKSLQNTTGWSSGGVEEESDDDFQPVKGHYPSSIMSESVANSVSSLYTSSVSGYQFSSKSSEQFGYSQPKSHPTRHRDKSSSSESDFSGDIRRFELRLNSLAVALLHRDILISNDDSHLPEDESVREMQRLSEEFFARTIVANMNVNVKAGRQSPQLLINRNHFRLHCVTIVLNGDEKANSSNSEIVGTLSVANLELLECLVQLENKKEEMVELIHFTNPTSFIGDKSVFSHPDLLGHFKYSNDSKRFAARNRTEVIVNLRQCRAEIDVTIIDRLMHILDNFNILWTALGKLMDVTKPTLNDVHAPVVDNKFEWKIAAPFVSLKFRFPIPDMRDEPDYNCSFFHRRDVYGDLLFVELSEITAQGVVSSHQLAQCYEFQAKSVAILFQESNTEKPIPFIFSGVDDTVGTSLPNGGKGFGWPRLVLRLYPKVGYIELEDEEERFDLGGHMAQSIIQTQKQEPSPFTAKMIKRESDTSHSKSAPNGDGEEIILPGSKEEMGAFIEGASHNALLQIDISVPSMVIQIPSKHFYEIIYNRFNTDLMLWVPRSSKPSFTCSNAHGAPKTNLHFNRTGSMFTTFSMCKSTVKTGSDSEEEDSCENLLFASEKMSPQQKTSMASKQQSKITVSIFVGQGVLDVFPHARDSSSNVIPGQFGEVQILFQEANLFCVSGYKGEPLLNYVCLQINNCTLYHCSLIPGGTEIELKPVDSYPSKYMLATIYKTQAGAAVHENATPVGMGSTTSDDMLTLAVRVQGQENHLKACVVCDLSTKNICVANSLNGVTIRHRMKTTYTSWLSQLIDFFDIIDYPVSHYQPWKVVTQLHQQLLNCVIDYRPLHLPTKAALTVENFNISSNITAKTATSILRFIAEEASLFISSRVTDERDNPEDLSINLRNDYVCVVDLGLFELSLRLTDNREGEPQTDLRASNNIVHIRTCADSAVALMELVKYIASDGDLCDMNATGEYKMNRSHESGDDVLVNLQGESAAEDDNAPCMGRGEVTDIGVPHLVEEAMNDTIVVKPRSRGNHGRKGDKGKVEVFFFPNEENMHFSSSSSQVFSDSVSSDTDSDTEFCVVDREVGIGYLGKSSVPEVRLLTKEPIRMVDNHFTVPVNKVDVLKAPKGYPEAMSKYTLREMTIVWHMYGGNDFSKHDSEAGKTSDAKKQVTIVPEKKLSCESLCSFDSVRTAGRASFENVNVSYMPLKSPELQSVNFVLPRASPRAAFNDCMTDSPTVLHDRHKSCSWQAAGGVNRQHDVLMELKLTKLKYQFEVYPKNTKQASRQVLIVQEVEISDRMMTSQINKFLYLYSSSTRPKQSHANMVVIKATNIRPELNVSHRLECCLRVSMLPLRLNIDQDSLLFLINFFGEISGNKSEDEQAVKNPPAATPVMNIENISSADSPSMMLNLDDERHVSVAPAPVNTPVFIRSFIFSPDVLIRLDYEGKRVDMSHGPLAGLIMGLGQLSCSELKLKRLCNRHGFLGLEKLISYALNEWLQDIKKNQLPSILGGVGPMYSLVQLFQGIRDLFWLPIEQYQKDGRIVRGLQRGANSFTTSTAMAALELTARLVYAIQRIAETAFDLVSPGPSIRYLRFYERTGKSDPRKCKSRRHHYKYNQPADIREGVASALQLVKEGFEETAQTLIRVASVENEVKGAVGAVGGIIREMPSAALTPIILATQATSNVLDGVRSHLVPDAKAEAALKWKHDYFS